MNVAFKITDVKVEKRELQSMLVLKRRTRANNGINGSSMERASIIATFAENNEEDIVGMRM